ncbi:MAG TPA: ATP-dependent DNA helicase RecG [Bacteroidia bacterium]|nr:ATP-dependent DNA helicase RecG [Bacteroidia bacterium]
MQSDFLETAIEFLKGVGPQRAEALKKELGIFTFGDLLHHFPFRYVDRTKFYTAKEATAELPYIQLKGQIKSLVAKGDKRRKYLTGRFEDKTGSIELKWFQGAKWILSTVKLNTDYILFGKPSEFNGQINIIHPELELVSEAAAGIATSMQSVYNTTEKLKAKGLDSKGILRLQKNLQLMFPVAFPETLSQDILHNHHLVKRKEAYVNIHFPENVHKQKQAEVRIKFEELFYLQLKLLTQKLVRLEKYKGFSFGTVGDYFNRFYKELLPFPLTEAQKRVIREIRQDCGSGKQMNRLLQGDVGSGKTVVALMCMLIAIDNGYQASLMAPTEILANQHAESVTALLGELGINVALLTGSTKAAQRKKIHEQLIDGSIQILIGTHALIEDTVQFKKLGFVVIDEQHRFGVEQRSRLWTKSHHPPHVLVMTATPIPRTLAMTLYGDLDVSVIDEMPPGRKPVKTVHRTDAHRLQVWGFLKKEIELGRQVYVVYPLIEESEKMDLKNLQDGYDAICKDFPAPKYRVSIVHGKMKAADKDFEMQRFLKKETHIMVATTVIEVGVNVPNASVMVIENSERFGLSQLHQLRGRVGRGADQSFCILMTGAKLGNDARLRIKTMCETNDGFKIAETDLQLRGPGDTEGTRQSGMLDLKLADISRDQQIVIMARDTGIQLLKEDPHFQAPANQPIREKLEMMMKRSGNWSRIS